MVRLWINRWTEAAKACAVHEVLIFFSSIEIGEGVHCVSGPDPERQPAWAAYMTAKEARANRAGQHTNLLRPTDQNELENVHTPLTPASHCSASVAGQGESAMMPGASRLRR
jgi:hypothetical protein